MPPTMKPAMRGPAPGDEVSMGGDCMGKPGVTGSRGSGRDRACQFVLPSVGSGIGAGAAVTGGGGPWIRVIAPGAGELDALRVERLLDPPAQLAGDVPLGLRPRLEAEAHGHLPVAERLDGLHLDRRQHVRGDRGSAATSAPTARSTSTTRSASSA